ncbi:MAG: YkgJ family cysteine cluster protein [Pirellulales bacterium]
MSEKPWYHKGLRFQCSQCGDCCTGAPGYVWVNKAEIEALAALNDVDVETFTERYTRQVGVRRSLVEMPNFDCVFLDGEARRCTVYEARPRQCRTWPFWTSNIRNEDEWQRTCQDCPGSGIGPLIPLEEIERQARVIRI